MVPQHLVVVAFIVALMPLLITLSCSVMQALMGLQRSTQLVLKSSEVLSTTLNGFPPLVSNMEMWTEMSD